MALTPSSAEVKERVLPLWTFVALSGVNLKQAMCLGYIIIIIIIIIIIYGYCHYYCHFYHPTAIAIPIHARPNPVLTLTIAECLRKPSRPWHAPAVLRFVSAQATGSAHELKKEEEKLILVRIAEDRSIPRACAERGLRVLQMAAACRR